jgi:hypothetical protein
VVTISGADLPVTFTTAEAERGGVSRRALERMLVTGSVERIGRGLYRRTDVEPVDYDLLEVWLRRGGKPADLMRMTKDFRAARPAVLNALHVLS